MTPLLSLRGVTVRYRPGDPPALDGVDLDIGPGERVALVGPSGAGKSTLISLANGLQHPTEGTVEVLGVDSRHLGERRHRPTRRRIGTVHQSFALVGPLRVAHNVAAGRLGSWSSLRALRALVRPVEVGAIRDQLDRVGIADKIWERTDSLSGGQQQRVAIARLLFQRPQLLLTDEPVSSLDPANSKAMLDVLLEACDDDPDRALLASLHDAPLALSHCQRVVGLRDGRIRFDEPAAALTDADMAELYAFEHDEES